MRQCPGTCRCSGHLPVLRALADATTVNSNFHAARFVCFFAFPFDFPRCSTLTDPAYIYSIDAAPRFVNAGTSISSDADSGTTNGET